MDDILEDIADHLRAACDGLQAAYYKASPVEELVISELHEQVVALRDVCLRFQQAVGSECDA